MQGTREEDPVSLDWSIAKEDGALRVDYRLTNRSDKIIHVFDSLLVRGEAPGTYRRAPGRAAVIEVNPGEAYVVLGLRLELPLATWHNQGWAAPLSAPPKTASLLVQVLLDEPEWHDMPTDAGPQIRVRMNRTMKYASAAAQPIPD